MPGIKKLFSEAYIPSFFDVSLWLKGIFAFSEVLGGLAAFFVPKQSLMTLTLWVLRNEFSEDPHDIIANYLLHSVENLSVSAQRFAAFYLFAHGFIKLWLIVGLLRKRLWYYPAALVIFALFIVYQFYRYTYTHSIWLLLITVLDLIVIGLTWHEYKFLKTRQVGFPTV